MFGMVSKGQEGLELEVMRMLLAGENPVLEKLRTQFEHVQSITREMTGVGFYANFKLHENVEAITSAHSLRFGDVQANIEGLEHGAGFVLHVLEGYLSCLEGYSYDEPWPSEFNNFSITYIGGNVRDLSDLGVK